MVTGQTEKVISKIEADSSNFFLSESINFRGDTLLHYACAKNNIKLVEYILKKNPQLVNVKNTAGELPVLLTNDDIIKSICESKVAR